MGGFYSRCFKKREFRVLINGLDAAGKTTILYRLKLGEVVTTIPTIGFNVETLEFRGMTLVAWDLGGRDKIRPLYRHYYSNTDVYIFVVDSTDRERMGEVKEELKQLVTRESELLSHVPFAIVCNKQDMDEAMGVQDICEEIDLRTFMPISKTWAAFGVTATTGEGLDDVMQWIYDVVKNNNNNNNDNNNASKAGNLKQDEKMPSTFRSLSGYVEKLKQFLLET